MAEKEEGEKEGAEEKNEEEKKKEEEEQVIVLRVDMHCESCGRKVAKSLKGFEGVEEVKVDSKARMVVVKGKDADPLKVCERVQKKSGRKVEIISPLPKPAVEGEEGKEEVKEAPPPEENKEEPKVITVILKVRMHCEACAQVLRRRIRKIDGVETVETDLSNERVVVKGFVDPTNLIKNVYQRTRKQASIIPIEEKEEEKKTEGEKKEEMPQAKEDNPQAEEKKEEAEEEVDKKVYPKKIDSWPTVLFLEHAYPHPPEFFSDENPNACSLM